MVGRLLGSIKGPLEIRAPQEVSVNQSWTVASPLPTVPALTALLHLDHVPSDALVIISFLYCVLIAIEQKAGLSC